MSQYYTDFTEYTTGTELTAEADWTDQWGGNINLTIEDNNGEALCLSDGGTTSTADAVSWDAVSASPSDTEVYFEYEMLSTASEGRAVSRGAGGLGSHSGYVAGSDSTSELRYTYYNSGSFTEIGTEATSLSLGTRYCIRHRVEGDQHYLRQWTASNTEPETWNQTHTEGTVSSGGWVGFFSYGAGDIYLADYGVGTNGDAAPTAPVTSTTTPISGTVTLDGTAQEGATVYVIDQSADSIVATLTTNANGQFSYEASGTGPFHVTAQHDDGTTQYNSESLPYIQ